ncbi:retinaldehyde-binding protein 1-like [Periplaneta americana]|uniref:retinaldehyde-binding protein 1-like n=1 Tax=Periplaneta americana TaxID=6978 RepID=UPI0037E97546
MAERSKSKSCDTHPEDEVNNIEDDQIRVQEAISKLRELVSEEKNLDVRMNDTFMLRYLRWSGFDAKKAFEKMVKVYKFKAKYEKHYCNVSPLAYKDLLSQNFSNMLEDRDQYGRRVIFINMGALDIESTTFEDCMGILDAWMELAMEEEESQKNGVVIFVDMAGFPMRLFRFFTPRLTVICALKEEMRPWIDFEVHIVNTSRLLDTLVSIVFPFLSDRFRRRINFHGQDWESLHKSITPEILPQEYGGRKSEINYPKLQQYLYDNEKNVHELCLLGYKKPEK